MAIECDSTALMIVFTIIIAILGVFANGALVYADYKQWKIRRSPEKILIGNLALTGIIATLIHSWRLMSRYLKPTTSCRKSSDRCTRNQTTVKPRRNEDFFVHNSSLICNCVVATTLCVIALDRYQALTKFSHQRWLTNKKCLLVVCSLWVCSLVVVLSTIIDGSDKIVYILTINIIWMSVCGFIATTSLWLTARKIRCHRQEVEVVLGPRQFQVEVKFTKSVVGLCFCYALFCLPFMVTLYKNLLNKDSISNCVKVWTKHTILIGFALIPVVYFVIDKRMRLTISQVVPQVPVSMTNNANLPVISLEARNSNQPASTKYQNSAVKANRHTASHGNESKCSVEPSDGQDISHSSASDQSKYNMTPSDDKGAKPPSVADQSKYRMTSSDGIGAKPPSVTDQSKYSVTSSGGLGAKPPSLTDQSKRSATSRSCDDHITPSISNQSKRSMSA